uniref:Uncharacterized protein n=1 Tax=Anguilla anguilla TaxID=7936 RepID=A0A0E9X775_ANGAN
MLPVYSFFHNQFALFPQ